MQISVPGHPLLVEPDVEGSGLVLKARREGISGVAASHVDTHHYLHSSACTGITFVLSGNRRNKLL